jgi:phosphoribosylaminoimidazole-succinocarboxamide synthase
LVKPRSAGLDGLRAGRDDARLPIPHRRHAVTDALYESSIKSLPFRYRGKVRDLYTVDARHMLVIATDRLSAFDVILPTPIPGKGKILTRISNFWFGKTRHIIANHLTDIRAEDVVAAAERPQVEGRAVVVRALKPLPVECIARGYLIGSGWKDYQASGAVCGIALPEGLRQADRLPEPIFTPSTKAAVGTHDENVAFDAVVKAIGRELAEQVKAKTLELYRFAAEHARARGIIIADTKFEFGTDADGALVLIDEALTPDSSRFWPADTYAPGTSPPSYDKQFVRDYLETLAWDKKAPGPAVPAEVCARTRAKYEEALARLTA